MSARRIVPFLVAGVTGQCGDVPYRGALPLTYASLGVLSGVYIFQPLLVTTN